MATKAADNRTQLILFKLADALTKLALELETNPSLRAAASEMDAKSGSPPHASD